MSVHLAGKDGYVDTGSAVHGLNSWNLTYSTDALETTDFADVGVKTYIVGCSGWTATASGYKYGAPQTQGGSVTLKLYESAAAFYYGTALIIETTESTAHDGVVTVSYSFQGTGTLSHTEA